MADYDAVVVGAGPNGLAAAITLARAGRTVLVLEASETAGGGARSAELTLPGYRHDVCAGFFPLAASSPFFRSLPVDDLGLRWIEPDVPLAHPLDGGRAVALYRSLDETARGLGQDSGAYRRLQLPLLAGWNDLLAAILGPITRRPRHPALLARFGLRALLPASLLARLLFKDEPARALFAGLAAHGAVPLQQPFTSAFGLLLGAAGHADGWPIAAGGAGRVTDTLVTCLRGLGGDVVTGRPVDSLEGLASARPVLLDITPHQLLTFARRSLPEAYARRLQRFRYGPGVFKLDYALGAPVPWSAAVCRRAGVVHAGGSVAEIEDGERRVASGEHPARPFVIVGQQSLFDASRAPAGRHTLWAYCHVPLGSTVDMTERIEAQIERFAPGFSACILARHVSTPAGLEAENANHVDGDIAGGSHAGLQMFFRPVPSLDPYATPLPGIFLCSSSTPPGAGVHGMCGYHAALSALRFRPRAGRLG